MKTDQIFIGNIKKCTKYEPHAVFCSSTYINGKRIVSDFFGGIESEDEIYKENGYLEYVFNYDILGKKCLKGDCSNPKKEYFLETYYNKFISY